MTLILETGAGVRSANSYVTAAYVTSYLQARGREEENDWLGIGLTAQEQACIKATDHIERFHGPCFKGVREFVLPQIQATATITFTGVPNDGDALVLGDQTYTMKTALSDPAVTYEVLIGADAEENASNLYDALAYVGANAGTTYSTGTAGSRHATFDLDTATITMTAAADGISGNDTLISSTLTNATVSSAFTGGLDGGSQPLFFPQKALYDKSGNIVRGIPNKLKYATAEYAIRVVSTQLVPDPATDDRGGSIKSFTEEVGPIVEKIEYVEGTVFGTLRPYPEADRLLDEYKLLAGAVR